MNAETYGKILLNAMEKSGPFDRLSLVEDETFDELARAVILEFVRRVEERGQTLLNDYSFYAAWHSEVEEQALIHAYQQISNEIKEAK